jgi:hypothetical protein
MWFEYTIEKNKFSFNSVDGVTPGRGERGVASDYSNVPFSFVPFANINDVGRQWIYNYTLALSKITLGNIRSKYDVMPIPNAEVRLDGDKLRQEGQQEIEKLVENLRETLEQTGKAAQMEKQAANEEHMQEILRFAPLAIYIF